MSTARIGTALNVREGWLASAIEVGYRLWFSEKGVALPASIRVAPGWPRNNKRSRKGSRVVGECWARQASGDGTSEIFIAPTIDDSLHVLEILGHELCHAADDCRSGHQQPFRRIALAIGLQGPMRSTSAGPQLRERLNALYNQLGPYPHARLDPSQRAKKQSTRLIKVVCKRAPNECYAFWTTRKHLDLGTPTCVCGSEMSEVTRRW